MDVNSKTSICLKWIRTLMFFIEKYLNSEEHNFFFLPEKREKDVLKEKKITRKAGTINTITFRIIDSRSIFINIA